MKIVVARPPNFDLILKSFPLPIMGGVIFTYGDTIYNPSGNNIHPSLIDHESVHSERQGDSVDEWWDEYIKDKKFRFMEEMYAHRSEYRYFNKFGRDIRRRALGHIASKLSSKLYGSMLSLKEAKRKLV